MQFSFQNSIRNCIKKQYENKLNLPSSLSVEIGEVCEKSKCCNRVV